MHITPYVPLPSRHEYDGVQECEKAVTVSSAIGKLAFPFP